jgi:hypothetical protein
VLFSTRALYRKGEPAVSACAGKGAGDKRPFRSMLGGVARAGGRGYEDGRMRRGLTLLALPVLASACKKTPPAPSQDAVEDAGDIAHVVERARCAPASPDGPFLLGAPATAKAPTASGDPNEPSRDDPLPFASEVGDGVSFGGGFAVGALHENAAAPTISVVTLGPDGRNARVVSLGATHGDVEPPRLAARGNVLVAGILEPDVNGRTLRLAKVQDGTVTWGATLHQKGGESQAFDIALGDKKGVVVWDEEDPAHDAVMASTFDVASASNATVARAISPPTTDAESPRLLARPDGGYWLAYIARAGNGEDSDAREDSEDIGFRWIEIAQLDVNGSPTGVPRPVTPKAGHVLVFDLAPGDDGAALLVYRYDDTPIGASGGQVMRTLVRAQRVENPAVLVEGDEVGAGVPSVRGSWLAVTDAADATRLAPIRGGGDLAAPLRAEPDIGTGEPIAADGDRLLVARPAGRAVKLQVLRCSVPPQAH